MSPLHFAHFAHFQSCLCVNPSSALTLGCVGGTEPHGSLSQELRNSASPACAHRTEPALKAAVKKGKKKQCNEKLETLIRSYLSKELLRRKKRSVPSASISVGSDVRPCLVQRALRKPELMSLVQLLLGDSALWSSFHPEFCWIATGKADFDLITASTCLPSLCIEGGVLNPPFVTPKLSC